MIASMALFVIADSAVGRGLGLCRHVESGRDIGNETSAFRSKLFRSFDFWTRPSNFFSLFPLLLSVVQSMAARRGLLLALSARSLQAGDALTSSAPSSSRLLLACESGGAAAGARSWASPQASPPSPPSSIAALRHLSSSSSTSSPSASPTARAYTERKLFAYPPHQVFDVVADVQHYDRFVPWCVRSTVLRVGGGGGGGGVVGGGARRRKRQAPGVNDGKHAKFRTERKTCNTRKKALDPNNSGKREREDGAPAGGERGKEGTLSRPRPPPKKGEKNISSFHSSHSLLFSSQILPSLSLSLSVSSLPPSLVSLLRWGRHEIREAGGRSRLPSRRPLGCTGPKKGEEEEEEDDSGQLAMRRRRLLARLPLPARWLQPSGRRLQSPASEPQPRPWRRWQGSCRGRGRGARRNRRHLLLLRRRRRRRVAADRMPRCRLLPLPDASAARAGAPRQAPSGAAAAAAAAATSLARRGPTRSPGAAGGPLGTALLLRRRRRRRRRRRPGASFSTRRRTKATTSELPTAAPLPPRSASSSPRSSSRASTTTLTSPRPPEPP